MLTAQLVREAFQTVDANLAALSIYTAVNPIQKRLYMSARRRQALRTGMGDSWATVSLVRTGGENGALCWFEGAPSMPGRERRNAAVHVPDGELMELFQFEKLQPGQIQTYLDEVDRHLNPRTGLWRLHPDGQTRLVSTPLQGVAHRLILIHGSFGRGTGILDSIRRAPNGRAFMAELFQRYDEIYLFEHPTLSVGAAVNAHELALAVGEAGGTLDMLAHCRGGLIARRLLETATGNGRRCRAVLVGCPMEGTSLASPGHLRSGLSMLTNYVMAMRRGGGGKAEIQPLLIAPLALLRLASSLGGTLGAVGRPIEAVLLLVPGLLDLIKANRPQAKGARGASATFRLAVVRSRFQSEASGWCFWKWFCAGQLEQNLMARVFKGDNDLVVDTDAMVDRAGQVPDAILDFLPADEVHHGNYFEQARTLDFILEQLPVQVQEPCRQG